MTKSFIMGMVMTLMSLPSFSQVGSIKTESYKAKFEQEQSIDLVSDYNGDIVIPIQVLKIGINEELYEMYPELKDKRVGLGVANIVLEFLESTDRFVFTEDKAEIKNKMIAQDKASDKGISSNKIEVKGNVMLAKFFVYIEVYDFSVSDDEILKINGEAKTTQITRLGLQVKFVDAETGEILTGSGLGEANTIKTVSILDGVDDSEIKFNQSTIGTTTKKSLETAASRIVSRMIKKGIFKS
jgi:curli biogenesis system outer membrane secretion channel CsgG